MSFAHHRARFFVHQRDYRTRAYIVAVRVMTQMTLWWRRHAGSKFRMISVCLNQARMSRSSWSHSDLRVLLVMLVMRHPSLDPYGDEYDAADVIKALYDPWECTLMECEHGLH